MKNQIKAAGLFTQSLWDESALIFDQLVTHPFATGLARGSLPENSFRHYLSQDLYYLEKDAQAFRLLAHRANYDNEQVFLLRMANDTVALEQDLNLSFITEYQITKAQSPSPVIGAYCDYLLDTVKGREYCIALAALLPCFWLYSEVGIHIHASSVTNNPYQTWIDCYHSPTFIVEIETFIRLVEQQAKVQDNDVKKEMREAFLQASQYELAFFDEAIKQK